MPHTNATIPLILLACAAHLAVAVPRPFAASVAHPGTWQTSCYRGETLAIAAQLVDGDGIPYAVPAGAEARLLWSTNNADWFPPRPATVTTGGLVRATWTPDMDCGADSYRIFLGVSEGGTNINYGANMLLRMLGSPGAVPNELPLPVRVLDFAQIAVTNAPWGEGGGTDGRAVTNIVEGIVADATNGVLRAEADPVFLAWAATNAPAPADTYATRPWRIRAEYVPLAASGAVTNADLWSPVADASAGIGARLSLEVDERPAAYAYDPPAGEWFVNGGTMGGGGVVAPTQAVVRAAFAPADGGAARSIRINLSAADPGKAVPDEWAVEGTWRWRCSEALLSRFAAATNSATALYPYCRPSQQAATHTTWTNYTALQRFGDGSGGYYGVDARFNPGFFWPALSDSLAAYTVTKADKALADGFAQCIAISPHYAVTAWHSTNYGNNPCPHAVYIAPGTSAAVTNPPADGVLPNGRAYWRGHLQSVRQSHLGDILVFRVRDAFPSNCIARLADAATLAALSPTFPRKWPAFMSSQHQTITPCATVGFATIRGEVLLQIGYGGWAMRGFDGLSAEMHRVHNFDSSHLVGTSGPSGQLIPLFMLYRAGSGAAYGPALFGANVDDIDAIVKEDSDGAERVWRWTPEELQ